MSEIEHIRETVLRGANGIAQEVDEYAHVGRLCGEGIDLINQGFDKIQASKNLLDLIKSGIVENFATISDVTLGSSAFEEPKNRMFGVVAFMGTQSETMEGFVQIRQDLIVNDEVNDYPQEVNDAITEANDIVQQFRNAADNL